MNIVPECFHYFQGFRYTNEIFHFFGCRFASSYRYTIEIWCRKRARLFSILFPRIGFADFVFCIFCLQLHIVRWPPPRFWHGAKRRGSWPQNLSYVLHFHVLMDSTVVSGRSCSKKVHFFFTPFSLFFSRTLGESCIFGSAL